MADSLIAPVRLGIIKPTSVIAQNITNDPLDVSLFCYIKKRREKPIEVT